ncbi:MAG: hypothetical protein SFZ23_07035 [Planctomycetota bacterium]|nr:hypothetical protein [Planctomycetota bacterium]
MSEERLRELTHQMLQETRQESFEDAVNPQQPEPNPEPGSAQPNVYISRTATLNTIDYIAIALTSLPVVWYGYMNVSDENPAAISNILVGIVAMVCVAIMGLGVRALFVHVAASVYSRASVQARRYFASLLEPVASTLFLLAMLTVGNAILFALMTILT